jgi:two-component system invasion response regulator UvrY
MVSILIIDDHALVRRGLKQTLKEEIRDAVFADARNAKEALLAVARQPWDIVILDIAMPDRDGFAVLQEVLRQRPDIKVLVLSVHVDHRFADRAMQLGACGYISKDASLSRLLKAVRQVLAGQNYLSPVKSGKQLAGSPAVLGVGNPLHVALSPREHEIMLAVAAGKGIGEIATGLSLSIKTVSTYKRRVLNKLHVDSTAGLIRYVVDHNLSESVASSTAGLPS